MRAIVLNAYGDVNQLELVKLGRLKPGPNEIKVRMVGAGVNAFDWKLRSGALQAAMPLTFPAVLGRDVSGEVVELGPDVTRFAIGARVVGLVTGAYAGFVVAPLEAWTLVPAKLNLVEAAALPLALLTGAQLIEESMKPQQGDVVLVTGALGSVGRVAVFVAKARGAKVWAGVRGSKKASANELGVDGIVALDSDAELEALPQLDAIADTVGGATMLKLLPKLRPGGTIASCVGEPAGAKELGLIVRLMVTHADAERLTSLVHAVADGLLAIPIAMKVPLTRAGEAQTHAEHASAGKVILTGRPRTTGNATESTGNTSELLTRDHILKILADGELAGVGTSESDERLSNGDEYLDLEQLQRGVQRAQGSLTPIGRMLSRKAIHEDTWRRILRQLAAAPPRSSTPHHSD